MKAIDIALKDMTRSLRSLTILVFMFGIPLLMAGMFYIMFGRIADDGGFSLPRTTVVIANLDKNAPRLNSGKTTGDFKAKTLSGLVVEVLQSEDMADLLEVSLAADAQAAKAAVDSQQAQVAVIIPDGFSREFADLNGEAVIEFYQDPTLTLGPSIVKSILNQFMDSLSGIKIAIDVARQQGENEDYALVGRVAQEFMDSPTTQSEDLSAELLDQRSPGPAPQTKDPLASMIGPILGGLMIFYSFYTGMATGESILREEEERTLPRLFTTPTPVATILTGKFLAVFLTVLVQVIVLMIAGRLMFNVNWGPPGSIALVAAGIILSASSAGIFVNSLLKDTKQSGIIFGGGLTLTGMLGMIRVFSMSTPTTERLGDTVALIVPQGWATKGIVMAMRAAPVIEILPVLLVLLLWSVVFFTVGVWRFSKRYA
ncbi:MAG: ABC transporter permease [Chloroflexota bacterium]